MNKSLIPFKLSARVGRSLPTEYFILANLRSEGATIGHLAGAPIAETVVDASGHRYRFAGVAPRAADGRFDVESLRTGEWIVRPGLVYLMEEKGRRARKA
ncbi:hypothetical protein LHFGNBLO_000095 [Mesorhizobium sp. AR10]|uniref:hypothetical protein n=1 Tax=Mesorhizobium sp. AR10 TaxID=2865839 RepID=UPI00216030F7|nr:hypothetical protein [Mesorhizobium sp. AR10]UVK38807.1 hypothetical protein LHFGNBLO_000095 [Mesorhizobium sp. AR10]